MSTVRNIINLRQSSPKPDALAALLQSKAVLDGRDPHDPNYRGRFEDAREPALNRWGVTGGNLRPPHPAVYQALTKHRSGNYLQFVTIPSLAREIVRYYDQLTIPIPNMTEEGKKLLLSLNDSEIDEVRSKQSRERTADEQAMCAGINAVKVFYGSTMAIYALISAVMKPGAGDVCLCPSPYYHSTVRIPSIMGGTFAAVETQKKNAHKPTREDFERWYKENPEARGKVKVVMLYAPHFLGDFYTKPELENIFAFFVERHIRYKEPMPLLIEDGVYLKVAPFDAKDERGKPVSYVPLASIEYTASNGQRYKASDYTSSVNSISKGQCAPSLSVGWATIPPKIPALTQNINPLYYSMMVQVAPNLQDAAAAALKETPEQFYQENNTEYAKRIELIAGKRSDCENGQPTPDSLLEQVNNHVRTALNKNIRTNTKLRKCLQKTGIADGKTGQIPENYRFVECYHYPQAGNILFLDFKGLAGAVNCASQTVLSERGHNWENSLDVVRHFLDNNVDAGGLVKPEGNGVALSSTTAMGFGNDDATRYVCKFQIAQMGHRRLIEQHKDGSITSLNGKNDREYKTLASKRQSAYDAIRAEEFHDVFLNRLAGGMISLLTNQDKFQSRAAGR